MENSIEKKRKKSKLNEKNLELLKRNDVLFAIFGRKYLQYKSEKK